jgi:hypothetical protein
MSTDTGITPEMIEETEAPERFTINSRERVDWYLRKLARLTGQSELRMHLEAGKVPPAIKSAFEEGLVSEAQYARIMQIIEERGEVAQ